MYCGATQTSTPKLYECNHCYYLLATGEKGKERVLPVGSLVTPASGDDEWETA